MIVKSINDQLSDFQKRRYELLQKSEQLTDEELEARIVFDILKRPVLTQSKLLNEILERQRRNQNNGE